MWERKNTRKTYVDMDTSKRFTFSLLYFINGTKFVKFSHYDAVFEKKKIQTLSVIGKIFNKKKNTEHLIKQNRDAQNQKEI